MKKLATAFALVTATIIAFGFLAWKCLHDPKINFLPNDNRAEWIIFPVPIDPRTHPVAMLDATFRRTFSLETKPQIARLLVRAAKRLELKINSETVSISFSQNWKEISAIEVQSFLRPGVNTIEARVFNEDAPPAFWLHLAASGAEVRTDPSWQASIAGSSWRDCAAASVPRQPGPGNLLGGGERILDAIPRILPIWAVFLVVAAILTTAIARWLRPGEEGDFSHRQTLVLLGLCTLAWAFLFWNNTRLQPFSCGYDSTDHSTYIKYIQIRKALPLPNEGYEMFQPPLYYALSAGLLSICRLTVGDEASIAVLRALTMIFGVANFVFVFLSVRLLFPGQRWAQIIALLTAAFLPMQLYLSHYITNETLAATLVSGAVYFVLRILKRQDWSLWLPTTVGILTGAAMLAKATSILLLPPLLGALVLKLVRERAHITQWFSGLGITLAATFAVSGWHYIRIWRHFGKPIVGNWESVLGFPWWQDPGFHMSGDYFRFGRALILPLFSGFNGFADGIYSTLWGDGLGGGLSGLAARMPWNYSLILGGYWIGLILTVLVFIGLATALYRFIRNPSPDWFLVIGFSAAVVIALIFMTLRVPSYAQIKAFYGLSALVPFCCFAAIGWSSVTTQWRALRLPLAAAVVFFSVNSFASVWICPTAAQHIYVAFRSLALSQTKRAADEATEASRIEPSNPKASYALAVVLDAAGMPEKAITQAEQCLSLDAADGDCHLQLAMTLAKQGPLTNALGEARQALQLLPERERPYDVLFTIQRELQQNEEALRTGRDALAVSPFDGQLHFRFGLAAAQVGDFKTALPQFGYASLLLSNRGEIMEKIRIALRFVAESTDAASQLNAISATAPDSPALLNELAWIAATNPAPALRDGARAVALANRACVLTQENQPQVLATAAAAYAEAGNFSEAIKIDNKASSLAKKIGDAQTASRAENMLPLFQSNQPYREEMQ